jgi:stage III sporulation protein AG
VKPLFCGRMKITEGQNMKGIINFKNEKTLKIVVLVGVGLILIIFLGDLFFSGNNTKPAVQPAVSDMESYRIQLEQQLIGILTDIEGAGYVKVMLTMENTEENIYADSKNLETVITPKVRGVVVVCDGGDSVLVKEKLVEAVTKVLGISSARVCVTR